MLNKHQVWVSPISRIDPESPVEWRGIERGQAAAMCPWLALLLCAVSIAATKSTAHEAGGIGLTLTRFLERSTFDLFILSQVTLGCRLLLTSGMVSRIGICVDGVAKNEVQWTPAILRR